MVETMEQLDPDIVRTVNGTTFVALPWLLDWLDAYHAMAYEDSGKAKEAGLVTLAHEEAGKSAALAEVIGTLRFWTRLPDESERLRGVLCAPASPEGSTQ